MIYCISDIHGEIDRFHRMLDMISFNKNDHLYILGDVIDRKPDGLSILKEIMSNKNMTMLLGNHEDMCLKTLGKHNVPGCKEVWKANGGNITYREMLYHMPSKERNDILRFLSSLPIMLDVQVNERSFRLVHGWPAATDEDKIWGRPMDWLRMHCGKDIIPVIGHTPTVYLNPNQADHFRIYHGKRGYICIDCGCGSNSPRCRLACLRLDDMQEFYT